MAVVLEILKANLKVGKALASSRRGSQFEKGSISVLIFGLFFLTLIAIFVITDIATLVVAQKSLVSATESAAMHASHALDREAYYRGENGPGVPIDCPTARLIVVGEISSLAAGGNGALRPEIVNLELADFSCIGDELVVRSTAQASLPFVLPGQSASQIQLSATIGVSSKRKS